jgi:quinol monooxygenase YgiN
MIVIPKIAASITHHVDDFDAFMKAFEAESSERKDAGILEHYVHRSVDDEGLVCVYLTAVDRGRLERFLGKADPKALQPSVELLVPQEDRASKGVAVAAALSSFDVESYDRWKAAFDANVETRRRASVVGYAISRSAANPRRVVVYLQAESAPQLRAMFATNELTSVMKKAGVCSPPEVRILTRAE